MYNYDCLLIVVADEFVKNQCYLGVQGQDRVEVELGAREIIVAMLERDLRWPDIKPDLTRVIEQRQAQSVFCLVHKYCCNLMNWYASSNLDPHLRLAKAEEDLRVHLGVEGVPLPERLEVFGLHFEPKTPLADALKLVCSNRAEFLVQILKILESSDPATLFQRISVVKHRIIGLFLPLDLTLQNWAENSDPSLRAEVDRCLCGKLEGARRLLEDACRIIDAGGRRIEIGEVRELLEPSRVDARDATSFHAWVNDLDQALDEVRRAVIS